jgi:hypothetical protein
MDTLKLDNLIEFIKKNKNKFTTKELAEVISKNEGKYISPRVVYGRLQNAGLLNAIIKGVPIRSLTKEKEVSKKKVTDGQLQEVIAAERKARLASEQNSATERKYKLAQKELDRLAAEVEALTAVSQYKPKHYHINPRPKKGTHQATPFMVLSDWHVEEKVDPRTIGGKNKYNLQIAKARAEKVFQNGLKLIQESANQTTVKDIAMFLIGDFITGNIHEENVENALLGPIPATHYAQDLLESGLNFLLANTPYNITCYCKVGNHSRITKKVRASTEADNSLETAMFVGMARNYRDNPRIKFCIEPSYYSITTIQGVRVRYHHGHAISYGGGVGGLHIPLRKAVKSWNETERADYDIMGHYHSFLEHSTYKYMINGSLIGYNAYAERVKAVLEPPVQGYGLFHSSYGVTSTLPIFAE